MRKVEKVETKQRPKRRPAQTMEARENQLISLAMDLAEERMRNGTASSQEIVHFLRLGSSTERIEKRVKEKQAELIEVKADGIKSMKNIENMYAEAMQAFKGYSGVDDGGEDDYDEYDD